MNSHVSSSCLLAAIAIFVTVMAVGGRKIVSPPAIIAGHNANSLVVGNDVFDNKSSTTNVAINITLPNTITTALSDTNLYQCCDQHSITMPNSTKLCIDCHVMCTPDAKDYSHLLCSNCSCYGVASCTHNFSDTEAVALNYGAKHSPNNVSTYDDMPAVYGMFTMSVWYQNTFLVLSLVSCFLMLITAFVYFFSKSREHSRYVEHVMMSIALSTYVALIAEKIRKPTTTDFQSTGIYKLLIIINVHGWQLVTNIELYNILKFMGSLTRFNRMISRRTTFHKYFWFFQLFNISITFYYIDIFHQVDISIIDLFRNQEIIGAKIYFKPSILTGLIPGIINIIMYIYLFKYNKIHVSSIHPDLLSFYRKRTSTRNQMLKISILMFIVDFVYTLDIIMEWDFTGIHILHLLKPCQGILVSYVFLLRPFAPVLYNNLLKRLRRREENANEVTANPIYIITTV